MILSLIYARSENRVIGCDGGLPWRLPDDFKHFKQTTMGRPIIMGRRTFEDHNSVLPGRTNIVLTSREDFEYEGLVVARSLDEALAPYRNDDGEVFIIGGAGRFSAAIEDAQRVYETLVHAEVEGDTVLPKFGLADWDATVLSEHAADERHAYPFTITRYDRPRGDVAKR